MSQNNLPQPVENCAIQCKDVTFSYGQVSVLNSANVTITTGQIFALLGPSGCGKTTLLRCILGRLKPQSGNVFVFGLKPDSKSAKVPGPDVGFMPQEVGLVQQFTIEDLITYFGRLFNMSLEAIRSRIEFLIKLLDLPDKKRKIKTLSGGEQRRVSFAIAIIHQPKLLVLDEPTVGQDSMLREAIWKHLKELSEKQKITILMTTHYVEEAGSADVVAMMRRGNVFAQEKPMELVKQFSCKSLDEAFFKLYQKEKQKSILFEDLTSPITTFHHYYKLIRNQFKFNLDKKLSLFRTNIILKKNIICLQKNLKLLMILIFFPSLIMIVLGTSRYGKDPKNIPISLYDGESNSLSQKFVEKIDFEMFAVHQKLSHEEAVDMVRRGKAWIALSIPKNFSSALEARIIKPEDVTDTEIDESTIKMYFDTSFGFVWGIESMMIHSYHRFLDEFLVKQHNYNPKSADIPIQFEGIYMINKNLNDFYKDFSAVAYYGIMSMIVYFFPMLMATHFITFERDNFLIERSLVAGVRPAEILIAHLMTFLPLLVVLVVFFMFTSFFIFDTFITGNLITVFFMFFAIGIQGFSFGLFVSTFFTERLAIAFISGCLVVPLLFISGIIYPIEAMPWFLSQLAKLSPLTIPVEALRSVALRGWTLAHFGVNLGFLVNFGFASVSFIFAFILF